FATAARQIAGQATLLQGRRQPDISAGAHAFAFDLHTENVQTPQNATWVQAERRRRTVGRAAWMPRERCQDMDFVQRGRRRKVPTTPQIPYWHLAIFNPFQELDRFLQYLHYNASGVKSLI
ncbi:hypothetical protein, partial [Pseudomonas abietaniphila]